jgi:hypothetical protein
MKERLADRPPMLRMSRAFRPLNTFRPLNKSLLARVIPLRPPAGCAVAVSVRRERDELTTPISGRFGVRVRVPVSEADAD